MTEKETINTGIALELELYRQVKRVAHDEWRSMGAQINMLLREALEKGRIETLLETLTQIEKTQRQILDELHKSNGG